MAGARIEVSLDSEEVRTAINNLLAASVDLTPLMRSIGEHLLTTTRERFVDQKGPDGVPWAPLSESTKRRNVDKILTESGILQGQLAYQARSDQVEVGSPTIYAGTHQFGASKGAFGSTSGGSPIPWGDIPARPFLGLSTDDEDEIAAIVSRFLTKHLGA